MKILYLLHTDWYWIKQRTQFLVENLCLQGVDIDVYYKYSPKSKGKTPNGVYIESLKTVPLLMLPFGFRRFAFARFLDRVLVRASINLVALNSRYDAIIVTHPLLFGYVENLDAPIVYDLHDDNAEFYKDGWLKQLIQAENLRALNSAKITIYSSNFLSKKFPSRNRSLVVRNAHGIPLPRVRRILDHKGPPSSTKRIFYFGTISEWFDFDLLLATLDSFDSVEFHIIGPSDRHLPNHPRLVYYGALSHEDMIEKCMVADAFMMPFVVNPLIEGVDPVKLYEYMAFPVPILCCYYEEIQRFSEFVMFYYNYDSFHDCVRRLVDQSIFIDTERRYQFLESNSWSSRASEVFRALTHV